LSAQMTDLRPDIDAAAKQMQGKLNRAWGRSLNAVEENLEPGELVLRIASGVRGGAVVTSERGLMVLTDHKVLFLHEGMVRSSQESIPLDLITAVAVRKGLRWSDIKTTGAQSNETITQVNKVDAEAMASALKALLANRAKGTLPTSEPALAGVGVAEEIAKLGALRDQGLLSDAEFASQKARLLGDVR
jgi:hypothetical protein